MANAKPELEIAVVKVADLLPYAKNAKLHPQSQVDQIALSIEEFGNCDPIAVWHNADGEMEIVEGHGRLLALRQLGEDECPVVFLDHLTDEQRRAYMLVHNQLTMNTGWDLPMLDVELENISIDMSNFGFVEIESPTIDWDDVEEISEENYEKPESVKLRCPICGGVDEALRFVKVDD